jgi:hypothetical protein
VLKFTGVVQRKEERGGERLVEIAVRGANRLGEHVAATVRVALP